MKRVLLHVLILAGPFFLCTCRERPEEKQKREQEIQDLRLLGQTYLEQDKLKEAEEVYRELLEKSPDDLAAQANLALVFLKGNRYTDAEKQLGQGLKKAPGNTDLTMLLARLYEMTGRKQEAVDTWKALVQRDTQSLQPLYNLARLQMDESPASQALREQSLKKLVERAPGNLVPRLELIDHYLKLADLDKATWNAEELPKVFPEFPEQAARFYRQTLQSLHAGKVAEARKDFLTFQNFMKVTSLYQTGLDVLQGPEGMVAGFPALSLSNFNLSYAAPGESIHERIRFLDVSAQVGLRTEGDALLQSKREDPFPNQFALGDFNSDDYADVYISQYDSRNATTVRAMLQSQKGRGFAENGKFQDKRSAGREADAVFADDNNDGYPDLWVIRESGNELYRNDGAGGFRSVGTPAGVTDAGSGQAAGVWDADQDGDLDILVLRSQGGNLLYLNRGDGSFAQSAERMGLHSASAGCSDVAVADLDDDGDNDLVLARPKSSTLVLSNERGGSYQDRTAASGLLQTASPSKVSATDLDNDGFTDLLLLSAASGDLSCFRNRGDGTFSRLATPWAKSLKGLRALDAKFFDFDNDGYLDLLVCGVASAPGGKGAFLFHNRGKGSFEDVSYLLPGSLRSGHRIGFADFDKDGDLDIFIANLAGGFQLLDNVGGNMNHYLRLKLIARRDGSGKNNYFGIGSKVEIRAGDLYQMKTVTDPELHFGLGAHLKADVVRILWTNGVSQDLFYPGTDQELLESESLKGSCAFLYTWDGKRYQFRKDMMWRSALGMPLGIMGSNTAYAPCDPSREYLKIPGHEWKAENGSFRMQVTEELWETAYCDQIEVVAIDHPAALQGYVDERFTLPPYSRDYKLYWIDKKITPRSVTDQNGTELLSLVRSRDDRYISNFRLGKYQGVTEWHDLILDPGKEPAEGNLLLFLNGWIFPSDASLNLAMAQSGNTSVSAPFLQVINRRGEWETVIPNLGFPMGKDKTMVIDLAGKFLTKDRRVRIRTNMQIYWDEIFFGVSQPDAKMKATRLKPDRADLHYRGFSALYRKGGPYGPHWFDYEKVTRDQKWRDLLGAYTRYGDVLELMLEADDRYVIMNSGDELSLAFPATGLPVLPQGWVRDFLVYSEGWIKDGDFNTAHGKTVEPLPFHAMKSYPYGTQARFPDDPEHERFRKTYNTRKVGTQDFRRSVFEMK